MRQLQLDIEPQLDARISDFSGPGWGHVVDAIRQLHTGLVNRFYVYGGAGTGKSHLLSAICDSYLELGRRAIKVSLLELLDAPIEAITSLEFYDLVALDDIDAISGVPHWQKAVFHLMNNHDGQLVFSSRVAPIELKLELPDLQSRLTQAVSVKVPNGSSYTDRQALLHSVMTRRGIHFDQQIIDYYRNFQTTNIDIKALGTNADDSAIITYNRTVHKDDLTVCISEIIKQKIAEGIPEHEICVLAPTWYLVIPMGRKLKSLLPDVKFDAVGLSPLLKNRENTWFKIARLFLVLPSPKSFMTRKRWASEIINELESIGIVLFEGKEFRTKSLLKLINSISSEETDGLKYTPMHYCPLRMDGLITG